MALETVLVSRSVTFDPSVQAEVLKDLERFASLGFSVYRQVGEIVTIPEARDVDPDAESLRKKEAESLRKKEAAARRADEAADAVASIRERHGLSYSGIGSLVGCHEVTVLGWRKQSGHGISQESHRRLMKLLRQSDSIEAGSSTLRDEARGAAKATAANRRKGRKSKATSRRGSLSDDQKIEVASLRESGKSLEEIAKAYGVSAATVCRACKELS